MTQFAPEWVAHQRKRWLSHDAHRFLRHDWERFVKPGAPLPWPLSTLVEAKANFDPNQPRASAGSPGGGRWTSGDSGGGSEPSELQDDETDLGGGAGDGGDEQNSSEPDRRYEVFTDETGEESWSSYANGYRADGSLAEQAVINRDGSRITSEFSAAGDGNNWDERHTVTLPDESKTIFERSGDTQTVYDGDGQVLNRSELGETDVDATAQAQPASWAIIPRAAVVLNRAFQAGVTLYNWIGTRNDPSGTGIISLPADVFRSGEKAGSPPVWVARLKPEELEPYCPLQPKVQNLTNDAASETNRADYDTPSKYGTAVHKNLHVKITGLRNENLRSEVSLLKTLQETAINQDAKYGKTGSIRIDVLENTATGVVCVYDIKTGISGLSGARIREIGRTVYMRYPNAKRIIIMETRPQS